MKETSKKMIIIIYATVEFADWQLKRLPILADYACYSVDGDTYLEVYEKNYRSVIRGIAKKWGVTPECAIDKKGFLHPMPIGDDL